MQKYEVLGIVNEGAYGIVYKAKNKESGEFVAIKKFKETDEEDEIVRKTTLREVKVLKMIKHENIVLLKEAFKRKGRLFLIFEYCDKNLLEMIEEKNDGLKPEDVKYIIYQLLKSIEYCHRHGVIHRDIKPENLLVDQQTLHLKLCDFGFARVLPKKSRHPLTDYVATRWYRSPELLLSSKYSKEVDMWAIGCIMGEVSDGEPLFPGESEIDQLFLTQKILGPLTTSQYEEFSSNPRFVGLRFPKIKQPETLEKHYIGKMSKTAISLMSGMLQVDPAKRLTAIEALAHTYFDNIREPEVDELIRRYLKRDTRESSIANLIRENSKTRDRSKRKTSVERNRNHHKSPYSKKKGSNSRKPKKPPASQMQKSRKEGKNTLNEASSIKSINSNGSKFYGTSKAYHPAIAKSGTKRSTTHQFMNGYLQNIQDHVFAQKLGGEDEYKYDINDTNCNTVQTNDYMQMNHESSFGIAQSPTDIKASVPEPRNSLGKYNDVPQFTKTNMSNLSFKNSRKQNKANYFGSSTVNDEIEEENEFEEETKAIQNKHHENMGDTGGMDFPLNSNSNYSKDNSFVIENAKSISGAKRKTMGNFSIQNVQFANQNVFSNQVQKMPEFTSEKQGQDMYNYNLKY